MENRAIVELHNGLFFIHGDEEQLNIPEIGDEQTKPIRSENCIVVFAQHAVDGVTEIILSSDIDNIDLHEIFSDKFPFKDKVIVSDPDGNSILELDVNGNKYQKVKIYADDVEYPTKIRILVG